VVADHIRAPGDRSGGVATTFSNESPRLWYGTSDAPAPVGVEAGRGGVSVVVGVRPASPNNAVVVRYRVDGGPVRLVRAILNRTDYERGVQYFRAVFPDFWSGSVVEYLPLLTVAGRQIGGLSTSPPFPSSFRLGARPVLPVAPSPDGGHRPLPGSPASPRLPFILDYLATATVPVRTAPEIVGPTPEGLIINWYPAPGGVFVGPKIRATVGVDGEHGMALRPDGVGIIGVRAMVTTDDGALVSVIYSGVLDLGKDAFQRAASGDLAHLPWPGRVQIATRLLTAHPKYQWLNRLQCLGVGELRAAELIFTYDLYAVR
jgi:hypothetical protein